MRPLVERYIRCSVTQGGWTVEPGVEWRDGDRFEAIAGDMQVVADAVARMAGRGDPMMAAQRAEDVFRRWWPDRAYFVEVHDSAGRWVQVFQPFGVPKNGPEKVPAQPPSQG